MLAPSAASKLAAALALAEDGLPLFPCRAHDEVANGRAYGAKSPLTKNGFHDATRDIDQITAWWERWADALIGVPTGDTSGIFVIDVDPRGASWYADNASRLNAGRVHRTRRGHHLLYEAAGFGCSTGTLADGVDTRGEGGYVIWWPAAGLKTVGDLEDVGELPEWVTTRLRDADAKKTERKSSDGGMGGDRSADLLRRVGLDVRSALADYEILARHRDHPHARDQTDPERAVQRCIDKCRSDTDKTAAGDAQDLPGSVRMPTCRLTPIFLCRAATYGRPAASTHAATRRLIQTVHQRRNASSAKGKVTLRFGRPYRCPPPSGSTSITPSTR
jgi:hypothetical protein